VEWNKRGKSQGHLGIPLTSNQFISGIPMMAQLLTDLGMPLFQPGKRADSGIASASALKMVGQFYVADALTGIDAQGRKIISSQDFVTKYEVKTVFGLGGVSSPGDNVNLVMIIFCRKKVEQQSVIGLIPLIGTIVASTISLIQDNLLFTNEAT